MKNITKFIVPFFIIALVILSAGYCIYFAYKYYTFPVQKSVHCYAYNNGEKLDVDYVIIDGKISQKVEKLTYDYTLDNLERLSNQFDDSITNRYFGYMQKLWHNDNEILQMKFYDFENISDDDLKSLLDVTDRKEYLKGDKDSLLKSYDNNGFTCEWSD